MRLPVATVLGSGAEIPATAADTLVFSVNVSQSASLGQFVIEIRDTSSIIIRNVISDERVLVIDQAQGDFAGQLRSQSLVVLSNRFQ